MVIWKPDKRCLLYCFYTSRIWMVSNQTIWKPDKKSIWKVVCSDFGCWVFRWLLYCFGDHKCSLNIYDIYEVLSKINFIINLMKIVRLFFKFFLFEFYFICRWSLKFERLGNTEITRLNFINAGILNANFLVPIS